MKGRVYPFGRNLEDKDYPSLDIAYKHWKKDKFRYVKKNEEHDPEEMPDAGEPFDLVYVVLKRLVEKVIQETTSREVYEFAIGDRKIPQAVKNYKNSKPYIGKYGEGQPAHELTEGIMVCLSSVGANEIKQHGGIEGWCEFMAFAHVDKHLPTRTFRSITEPFYPAW